MQLNEQQLKAVKEGGALRFSALESEFVVLRADVYERLEALLPQGEIDVRQMYPAMDSVFGKDWDDPKMAEYDRSMK